MNIVAGVDVGNKTTEVAIAQIHSDGEIEFIGSFLTYTTGMKGTRQNVIGIRKGLQKALDKCHLSFKELDIVRINEAAPVIGDVAMETITETIMTESTMIGHNPGTPGGFGLGSGVTIPLNQLLNSKYDEPAIVVIPQEYDFEEAAKAINRALGCGIKVGGAIAQNDDGVLIFNRLKTKIPIVDEVRHLERIPLGMPAAVEVAQEGNVINYLSNPYGIATIFSLSAEETKRIVPVAKALIGNRSAVVIRTPQGEIQERQIPAGKLIVYGTTSTRDIDVELGSIKIMELVDRLSPLEDVQGEPGTNAGGMLERVRVTMSNLTGEKTEDIKICDILGVDTMIPQKIVGGLAEEFCYENAVALAAMVKTSKLPMQRIAQDLEREFGTTVEIAGVEANMAILGALTTPGTDKPLVILDMGAGSTDAALISQNGIIQSGHFAGAGDMVTMLINSELQLNDIELAERIKIFSLAKVVNLYSIRLEDGSIKFFDKPLPSQLFARVILLDGEMLTPIPTKHSLETIRLVRQEAKEKVFTTNALRALREVIPSGDIKDIDFVVMVGGSALDFEIPHFITKKLAQFGIVCGAGNIRGTEGPRNAVATGLVISYGLEQKNIEVGD